MDNLELHSVMTSCEEEYKQEFLSIVSKTDELHKFANILTSDFDHLIKIIKHKQGLNRVMSMLGISDDINAILFYPIMIKFREIMTHENGYDLVSRILNVCNIQENKMFWQITYHHALDLAHDDKGCKILKKVITMADDLFQDEFLELISDNTPLLWMDDLGISVVQHVLQLDFTRKTTQDNIRLHELMAEFDESLSRSDISELHKLASKLTSDSDFFVEFVQTIRGSLMVQVILGKSEEIDIMFLEAIKNRFIDVTTDATSYDTLLRTVAVFGTRGDKKVCRKIQRLVGVHALELTKDPLRNTVVLRMINIHDLDGTEYIACGLQCHYIELSFLEHESDIVEKLLGEYNTDLPLVFIVMEIIKCDEEDTLVRLAKDCYGNKVLKKTLEVAKERRGDLFEDLVDKLKPFVDRLRGTQGVNIAAMIESELETIKDRIVSEGK